MRHSATFGWPIEEQADARVDFPIRTDGPRTDGIDADLGRLGVRSFATAEARNAAIPDPAAGQVCWLDNVKRLEVYSGGGWRAAVSGDHAAASSATVNNVPASVWTRIPLTNLEVANGMATLANGNIWVECAGRWHLRTKAQWTGVLAAGTTLQVAPGVGLQLPDEPYWTTGGYSWQSLIDNRVHLQTVGPAEFSVWVKCSAANQPVFATLSASFIGPT